MHRPLDGVCTRRALRLAPAWKPVRVPHRQVGNGILVGELNQALLALQALCEDLADLDLHVGIALPAEGQIAHHGEHGGRHSAGHGGESTAARRGIGRAQTGEKVVDAEGSDVHGGYGSVWAPEPAHANPPVCVGLSHAHEQTMQV